MVLCCSCFYKAPHLAWNLVRHGWPLYKSWYPRLWHIKIDWSPSKSLCVWTTMMVYSFSGYANSYSRISCWNVKPAWFNIWHYVYTTFYLTMTVLPCDNSVQSDYCFLNSIHCHVVWVKSCWHYIDSKTHNIGWLY